MLGDAILSILVNDGHDVRTFAHPRRDVTRRLAQVLEARDATCIVRGCGRSSRLELDRSSVAPQAAPPDLTPVSPRRVRSAPCEES